MEAEFEMRVDRTDKRRYLFAKVRGEDFNDCHTRFNKIIFEEAEEIRLHFQDLRVKNHAI